MSRSKKTRRISDIMPARKADKKPVLPISNSKKRKPTRYELDVQAREEKKKRKHKGLPTGSRNVIIEQKTASAKVKRDPRVGSRKKVPLMVEFVNKPEKGQMIKPVALEPSNHATKATLSPEVELAQLENNECLNQLLDQLEAGKVLSAQDQQFVDECLDRVHELMIELGIEDDEENNEDLLLRQFETIDINKFK
ncbi:Der GTPase-activating protein YihI [[Haemophilus] ducreyi]|uniref:Der GTPase-activating protein YihI n=1 Tax=Haemophilus ducreyi TaxID=730 RepID=UPI000655F2DD|nr:Der GTPase-activating protein YihI [[Haemophilus] ducreyi]AKO45784.1 aminotransferase [[Haemophilus] ducreyi]AKO47171.1 aminotransferase [[Haemophilus] ducreyi]AKO48534.1 aminotransferase [[Haemophilus] ducreyi]AKO49904.1 aminotransferase [[Haemophilus] ducreyi]ANF62387.1 GTPase-activating protein [[Haemophilus] ducreyi]